MLYHHRRSPTYVPERQNRRQIPIRYQTLRINLVYLMIQLLIVYHFPYGDRTVIRLLSDQMICPLDVRKQHTILAQKLFDEGLQ